MAQGKKKASKKVSRRSVPKKPAWVDGFLADYARSRSVAQAAERSCVTTTEVYEYRKNSEEFDQAMKDVWRTLIYDLEDNAMHRAAHGWDEPVFFKGEVVGSRRVFSTALSIFMLKANMPDKYHLERQVADTSAEEQAKMMRMFLINSAPRALEAVQEGPEERNGIAT